MPRRLPILRLSYDSLRSRADRFLKKYNVSGTIPVPIEDIIDVTFKVDIIPLPELHSFDVVAYISKDLTSIYVDGFVYESRPNRLRFSLAHEFAHAILHRDVFKQLHFSNIKEWKSTIDGMPEEDYGWLEWQASALAGLILVPADVLQERFDTAIAKLRKADSGATTISVASKNLTGPVLAGQFEASHWVIEKRSPKYSL